MAHTKILFINLGYARGIGGRLAEHIRYAHRHFYCSPIIQKEALRQFNELIVKEKPDVCCLVEINRGSFASAGFDQLAALINETYSFSDIENKYAQGSFLRSFAMTSGNCNAFIAKRKYNFEKLFFTRGMKRLVYKICLDKDLTLFFAHFSLKKTIRAQQIIEARNLMSKTPGEVIFLGDFNILSGLHEINPLLDQGRFILLNRDDHPTFFFHKQEKILDLCVCSPSLAEKTALKILPQSYSDHAALIVDI